MKKDIGWKSYLLNLITSDDYFKHMEEDALELVTLYTNSKELISIQESPNKGGTKDVCKAITDLMEDSRQEGRMLGISQGITALVNTLRELDQTSDTILAKLMEKFQLTEEEARKYL